MRISDDIIEKLLERTGVVTAERLSSLKDEAARSKKSLQDTALEQKAIDETALVKAFADYSQIPYVELNGATIPSDILNKIPERIARQYNAVLFNIDKSGTHHLAMEDPDDVQALNFIEKEIGENTRVYIATRENILAALENYHTDIGQELGEVSDLSAEASAPAPAPDTSSEDIADNSPVAQTVNLLLEYAIRAHASDIHIEPREDYVQVRYRIDGVLKEVNRLPRNVLGALVSRIKILSNLKIDEHRVPQDGRFKIKVGGRAYALRVSSLPVSDGEKLAIRILDESNQAVGFESLGYWGQQLQLMKLALRQPNGMILMTGPTGSGKSTSLFSALTSLNTPDVNISTIEDPVEYRIPGVNQTQTNDKAGMTFAGGLRALLRQDPNIIMVGEIRDSETADLGVQAALTGHLVFSSLHTNDAATCLPRLLDMGVEPFLIASTIRVVVGQRLVRLLHTPTRQSYAPSVEEQQAIYKLFSLPAGKDGRYIHQLEKQAAAEGIGGDTPLATDENGAIKTLWRNDQTDENDDAHEGFKSRIGIYEVLNNTPDIQKLITTSATSEQIATQAIADGMVTMQTDGLIKALRGLTTIEEVLRVSKE